MNRYILAFLLVIGCTPAHDASCDYCGRWQYTRFEYAGRITADCTGFSHNFENTHLEIGNDFFTHTYSIDSTPQQISDVVIATGPIDDYENVPSILISKDGQIVQKLYLSEANTIYIYLDGCRFYFTRAY